MSIRADHRHLYLQVIDRIKRDIEKGTYGEKQKLPSEFELSKELGVSRATLREALRVLEEESVIVRKHGVGTFVNAKPLFTSGIEQLDSITAMIKKVGKTPGTILRSSSRILATDEVKEKFANLEVEDILLLERVRTADDVPVCYCLDKIPMTILPSLEFLEEEESIMTALSKRTKRNIQYAVTEIEPIGYHEKISPILQCGPETALLVLKQVHYDQHEQPILYSINYFRADKFSFHVLRKRG
jgi:GntR family transcriptional regulator